MSVANTRNGRLRASPAESLADVHAAGDAVGCTMRWGVVELRPAERLDELMARGDAQLYRIKNARPRA